MMSLVSNSLRRPPTASDCGNRTSVEIRPRRSPLRGSMMDVPQVRRALHEAPDALPAGGPVFGGRPAGSAATRAGEVAARAPLVRGEREDAGHRAARLRPLARPGRGDGEPTGGAVFGTGRMGEGGEMPARGVRGAQATGR